MSIADLLRDLSDKDPHRPFARTMERELTAGELQTSVLDLAAGFQARGIGHGHVVPFLLPSGIEFLQCWLALTELGAVAAPMNTSLRGPLLSRVLERIQPAALVTSDRYATNVRSAIEDGSCPPLVVVTGDATAADVDHPIVPFADSFADGAALHRAVQRRSSLGMLMFTSGTSGSIPSACMYSNEYILNQGRAAVAYVDITADDVCYAALPMFHVVGSTLMVVPALLQGAVFAASAKFDPVAFWDEARTLGATIFSYVGSTLTELWKQPVRPDDIDNPVRTAFGVPVSPWAHEFEARFGLELRTNFGMNEAVLTNHDTDGVEAGTRKIGPTRAGIELAIVDDEDFPVPTGEMGQIVVRPTAPGNIFDGYYQEPERTVAAWRNLWFHTGDRGVLDDEGNLHYHGRGKDVIRRKGENIAPAQVEDAMVDHHDVMECAVFGIADEAVEEEVMAVVVGRPGTAVTPELLVAHLETLLPRYMIPRYFRFVDELPKSASNKVEKYKLIEAGVTLDTHDRAPS